jgi:hypothetical protein
VRAYAGRVVLSNPFTGRAQEAVINIGITLTVDI